MGSKVAKRQDIAANFNRVFKNRCRHLVNGFWFVPLLISLLGPLLALFFLALDNSIGEVDRTFFFSGVLRRRALFSHFVRCKPQPNVFHMANENSILEIRKPTFREYIEVFLEIGHYTGGNTHINNNLLSAVQKII